MFREHAEPLGLGLALGLRDLGFRDAGLRV